MSLFETIEKDYVQAYKAKDAVRLTVLRLLKTAVKNRLVDLCRPGGTLDDAEMLDIVFGNRIYDIADQLHTGSNEIEVRVVTVLGNYMHTLTDNATAQKFTAGRKEWPTLSLGILGPVTLYK